MTLSSLRIYKALRVTTLAGGSIAAPGQVLGAVNLRSAPAMLAQILSKHGIAARVEGPDTLSTSNIFRMETKGVMVVCVSFMDTSNVAQMRYAVRRLRRKLPNAQILLGAWLADVDLGELAKSVKADGAAATLRSAAKFCLTAASAKPSQETTQPPAARPAALAAS